MGKNYPYFCLKRLLVPEIFSTDVIFEQYPKTLGTRQSSRILPITGERLQKHAGRPCVGCTSREPRKYTRESSARQKYWTSMVRLSKALALRITWIACSLMLKIIIYKHRAEIRTEWLLITKSPSSISLWFYIEEDEGSARHWGTGAATRCRRRRRPGSSDPGRGIGRGSIHNHASKRSVLAAFIRHRIYSKL